MSKYNGIERYIFSDLYVIFEKYVNCKDEDATWFGLWDDIKVILNRYEDHPLAEKIALAVILDLENRIIKKNFKNKDLEYWENVKKKALYERAKNKTN